MKTRSLVFRSKNHPIRLILFQVLSYFLVSTLAVLGDDIPFTVTNQTPYLYTANMVFFDMAPAVRFTLKDFTRTNEKLQKKYDDEHSNGTTSSLIIHLNAYVVPIFSDDQYSIQIVADHPLSRAKLEEIALFVEKSMLVR